jgi:hypothetical protein
MALPQCYKATVNESETITAAKPFYAVRCRRRSPAFGFGFSAGVHLERS